VPPGVVITYCFAVNMAAVSLVCGNSGNSCRSLDNHTTGKLGQAHASSDLLLTMMATAVLPDHTYAWQLPDHPYTYAWH
jgi:hypothetical protein